MEKLPRMRDTRSVTRRLETPVWGDIHCTERSGISSRLISIRISARPYNITVIQVHTLTSDQFHEQLDSIIAKTPKKDILLVQGNWNAKVDTNAYQHYAGTEGRFGIGETNDRGWRLREFAKSHRLTLANTFQPHKLSRS